MPRLFILCVALLAAACTQATQHGAEPARPRSGGWDTVIGESIEIGGVRIPRDTIFPPNTPADYSRYNSPAVCERAMHHVSANVRRQGNPHTSAYDPERDTIPPEAVKAARDCAAKFTAENVPPGQLLYLFRLSVAIDDKERAVAVLDRWVTEAPNAMGKANILFAAIETYLRAKPVRLRDAEVIVRQIDALGQGGRIGQLQAHHALLAQYALTFDIWKMEREIAAMMQISPSLSSLERDYMGHLLPSMYLYRAMIVAFQQGPAAAVQVLQDGKTALAQVAEGNLVGVFDMEINRYTAQMNMYGVTAPKLEGRYWYKKGDTTSRPSSGKVSLLLRVNHNCGEVCYPIYAAVKRFDKKYSKAGLEITLVAKTVGFSRNSGVQTPDEESEEIRKYFLEDRDLPVTLVVQETPFTTLPDGRRMIGQSNFDRIYTDMFSTVIINRAGAIAWAGVFFMIENEAQVDAYLKRIVHDR